MAEPGGAVEPASPDGRATGGGLVTLGETMALLSTPGVTPLRHAPSLTLGMAGAESNVAIGARRLGVPAAWIGRVGDDEFGRLVLSKIRGEDVDASWAVVDDCAPTGLMVKERRTASVTRVLYYRTGSAGSRLCRDDVDVDLVRRAGVLHVSGITPALSHEAAEAVRLAVETARAAGVPVSIDVNFRRALWEPERARAALRELAALADVLFATEEEAAILLGGSPRAPGGPAAAPDSQEAAVSAKGLSALGPGQVVVKRGARGAVAWCGGKVLEAPPYAVESVDPVGAGDAFAAAWLAEMLGGAGPETCLASAAVAGAFAVTVSGDWEGLPTRRELSQFLAAEGDVSR